VAVKLRLMRMGKKKQPTYRVVAADSRSPRDGRFIEIVGTYAPRGRSGADPDAIVEIDNVKALKWLRQGATPTERVEKLLKKSGAWGEYRPGEAPTVPAAAAAAPAAAAAAPAATPDAADAPADAP
jgi:small subunit ribosomal protein S16